MTLDGAHHDVQREGRDHRSEKLEYRKYTFEFVTETFTDDEPRQLLIEETSTFFEGKEHTADRSTER